MALASSIGIPLTLGSLPPPSAIASVATLQSITSPPAAAAITQPLDLRVSPHMAGTLPPLGNQLPPPLPTGLSPSTSAHTSRLGMILSPASDPIPFHLVNRIQSGEFVEMRELLADNIALHNQTLELHGQSALAVTPASLRPTIREVPSLTSWMYCFAAYMAVRSQDPLTRDMLAYARLVIREALRHGGEGWREYERSFRRQVAIDPSIS